MRVLSAFDKQQHNVDQRKKRKISNNEKKQSTKAEYKEFGRPDFTDEEVRERILKHRQTQTRSQEMAKKQKDKQSISTVRILESDIKLNNPNDPATIGKLRTLLKNGAFKFSEKERQVLAKILAEE